MLATQQSYDLCMEYAAFNIRASVLLAATPYTGFARWHVRNHEIFDDFNKCVSKYIGSMYSEIAQPKTIQAYTFTLPDSMKTHVINWISRLNTMKDATMQMAMEAENDAKDSLLSCKFYKMNKTICNEIYYLHRVRRRISNISENDLLFVNMNLHDYFKKHPKAKMLNISV